MRGQHVKISLLQTGTWLRWGISRSRPASRWETTAFLHAPGFDPPPSSLPGPSWCRTRWWCTVPPCSWRPWESPACCSAWPFARVQRKPSQTPAGSWCSCLQMDTSVKDASVACKNPEGFSFSRHVSMLWMSSKSIYADRKMSLTMTWRFAMTRWHWVYALQKSHNHVFYDILLIAHMHPVDGLALIHPSRLAWSPSRKLKDS